MDTKKINEALNRFQVPGTGLLMLLDDIFV